MERRNGIGRSGKRSFPIEEFILILKNGKKAGLISNIGIDTWTLTEVSYDQEGSF